MWLAWAPRSRLEPFVTLARTVREHRERIEAAFDTGASNGLAESTNTRACAKGGGAGGRPREALRTKNLRQVGAKHTNRN